ncbi:MAG: hypothetical protein ABJB74_18880 [Gemmatimonas sp.]
MSSTEIQKLVNGVFVDHDTFKYRADDREIVHAFERCHFRYFVDLQRACVRVQRRE